MPLSPTKSRIVEAICIILTNSQLQSVKTSGAGIVLILYLC